MRENVAINFTFKKWKYKFNWIILRKIFLQVDLVLRHSHLWICVTNMPCFLLQKIDSQKKCLVACSYFGCARMVKCFYSIKDTLNLNFDLKKKKKNLCPIIKNNLCPPLCGFFTKSWFHP